MALLRVDWNPGPRKLRVFGIGLLALTAILAGAHYRRGQPGPAPAALGLGAALGVVTLAFPAIGLRIYKAWMCVAFAIGTTLSTAMLLVLYYLMLTPLGLIFRLLGRDALRLKRPPLGSYWIPLEAREDKTYYERLS